MESETLQEQFLKLINDTQKDLDEIVGLMHKKPEVVCKEQEPTLLELMKNVNYFIKRNINSPVKTNFKTI